MGANEEDRENEVEGGAGMSVLPARRMLVAAAVLAIAAGVAGPLPQVAAVWVIGAAVLAAVALLDLAVTLRAEDGLGVTVPEVVRFGKDRAGAVPVTFRVADGKARVFRFALGLPEPFADAEPELVVSVPAGGKPARIEWGCTPGRRGSYRSVLACWGADSALGWWDVRRRRELACELRVYPNLFADRGALAALFLERGQFGAKVQRTVGRGRDFEKLREYLPGDGFDEIHWKATAKRGQPITKVFQAERTQEIFVVIDASRLSARPVVHDGVTQTVLERYVTAALILLLAAERQGDRFGLLAHDEQARVFLPAGGGRGHYAACREALLSLQAGEGTPDISELVRLLRTRLRRRALLFFLTDLTDPVLAEDFARHAGLLARQHLVMVNQLRAPGVAPLFSGEEVGAVDEIYGRLAGHARWSETRALAQTLKAQGVTANLMEDETLAAELVSQYLRVKRRQAL